jgi:hypothetical protein
MIDLPDLERWSAAWRKPARPQLGIGKIHLGTEQKSLTVASNLAGKDPLRFGQARKKETPDAHFRAQLSVTQRRGVEAAGVEMLEPYRLCSEEWAPD